MNVRRATPTDIDALINLFDEARATIRTLGIDQWQNGYPDRGVISEDILCGVGYVLLDGDELVAAFTMLEKEDAYDVIDGAWQGGDAMPYLAIHRVAIAVKYRGGGIAKQILAYAARHALALGKHSLRIDTHEGNVVMRRMLEKNGFVLCGTVYLSDGQARVAYEKLLCEPAYAEL